MIKITFEFDSLHEMEAQGFTFAFPSGKRVCTCPEWHKALLMDTADSSVATNIMKMHKGDKWYCPLHGKMEFE